MEAERRGRLICDLFCASNQALPGRRRVSKSEPKDKSFEISKGLVWEAYIVRGWMNYYGRFNRAEMYSLPNRVNTYVMRWARKKYVRLRSWKRFKAWWRGVTEREPELFAHWAWMRAYRWRR